jgi:hypothetical protein
MGRGWRSTNQVAYVGDFIASPLVVSGLAIFKQARQNAMVFDLGCCI